MPAAEEANPPDADNAFFKDCPLKRYEKGEFIIRAGDPPDGVYYIADGLVKIYSINDLGEEYLHIIYRPGEAFPLLWALKRVRRNVFYEALTPLELLFMPMHKFKRHLSATPGFSEYVLSQVSEQFSIYVDRIENLEYRHANERLAYRILFLASRMGVKQKGSIALPSALTQQLIADSINMTRETVSREIEKLQAKGILRYSRHQLVIMDIKGLMNQISEPVSSDYWGLG